MEKNLQGNKKDKDSSEKNVKTAQQPESKRDAKHSDGKHSDIKTRKQSSAR
jgi:hypothetical protein